MNGEMYQICTIVASAKKAIRDNTPIMYSSAQYVKSITFSFLERDSKTETVSDVSSWLEYLRSAGVQDFKMLCPHAVQDRSVLGFSNTTQSSILCFFEDGRVTYFTPIWEYEAEIKKKLFSQAKTGGWHISYTEYEWQNPPSDRPHFENNAEDFRKVLADIRDFADKIECSNFAKVFGKTLDILNGAGEFPDEKYGLELPQMPEENLRLFEAASMADVFGAMGSWNDEPPYMAHEKGLDNEYETLSAELLKNIRLAILYAVNEW